MTWNEEDQNNLKITEIKYARLKNLGNFEHERVEATAEVGAGEDPKVAAEELRQFVDGSFDEFQTARKDAEVARLMESHSSQLPFAAVGIGDIVDFQGRLWKVDDRTRTTLNLTGLNDASVTKTINALEAYQYSLSIREPAPKHDAES